MPNLVNTACGETPPILNPECGSWYDTLYETEHCHAADKLRRQQAMEFALNCCLKLIQKHITAQY